MTSIKAGLNIGRPVIMNLLFTLLLVPAICLADAASQAHDIIKKAIENAGGAKWNQISTMVIHESQARTTDTGLLQIELVHYMDTKGRGYRMEINSAKGKQIYGWDGKQFWAVVDDKPGDEDQVKEAKRLISDAFYRFSLPFVLDDPKAEMEYAGKDSVNGVETDSVKITYTGGPVDRYWDTGEGEHQAGPGAEKHDDKAGDHAMHAEGDHHSGKQVYFYHFDKDGRIVKIYFSHHGDDSYETFLFDNFTTTGGITREQSRTLIREDGNKLYDTKFSQLEFRNDADTSLYKSPNH